MQLSVAEAGVELSQESSENTHIRCQVVQKAVQGLSDVADIAVAVARLTSKRRAALVAMIDAAREFGRKGASR